MHIASSVEVVLDHCKGMLRGLWTHSEPFIVASSGSITLLGSCVGCEKLSRVCTVGLGSSILRGRPGRRRGNSSWDAVGFRDI